MYGKCLKFRQNSDRRELSGPRTYIRRYLISQIESEYEDF